MDEFSQYRCPCCGERNEVKVDLSAGLAQSYVEDCHICCRPNVLSISISRSDDGNWDVDIIAEPES